MIRTLVALFRAVRLSLHLLYGLMLAVIYPWFSRSLRQRILRNWSAKLLGIFDIRLGVSSFGALHHLQRGLIVTNHISWLDVFVLNAVAPMRFVAKSEVRRWPVIGWLCMRAGTLFIERGKARAAARINLHLIELLEQGECMAVFPEGTTTDGRGVAHFHSSLLQPAIDAGTQVHPIAIRYQDNAGRRRTDAAYTDDLSFGASLWSILCSHKLQVQLIAALPLDAGSMDRRTLTQTARREIESALHGMTRTFEPDTVTDLSYSLNACATTRT
jgi:1-acyl-sn-glycerol-3-phosphate acyltransferase